MIDKLIVLSMAIDEEFRELASVEGQPRYAYRHVIDLRHTSHKLPVLLHCDGRHNRVHKIEVIGVAKLGLRRTRQILKAVIPDLSRAWIYRIDLCVDLLGKSVWGFAESCYLTRVQNFRMYRKRGAVSIYLQHSHDKVVVFYDKRRELEARRDPLARIFRPRDSLTRLEVQLIGSAVPHKKLRDIHRYAEINPLKNLVFAKVRARLDKQKPIQFLAATGLVSLIEKHGLHAVSKIFPSSEWAWLKKKFLESTTEAELPRLSSMLKKSIEDWLENRIRFPRPRSEDEQ